MSSVLTKSNIPDLPLLSRGKVRDLYAVGEDRLLMVASDRISAFDVVLPTPIPRKGEVLTRLSVFWFEFLRDLVGTHFITADVSDYPTPLYRYRDQLEGRSMLVKKLDMCSIECVVRGYIVGSGWKDYNRTGGVCGIPLPEGLQECEKLHEPIFTPSTKADVGHDENISFDQAADIVGAETAAKLRDLSITIYERASLHGLAKGLILADTKFEFGVSDGQLVLADEVLTPDSSRYWPLDLYKPGQSQPSFDKQYVRDYLEQLRFNKRPPGPELAPDVVENTSRKYVEAYRRITGNEL